MSFLGIPSDETEFLKYRGICTLFAGKSKVTEIADNEYGFEQEYESWIMETEEDSKSRLIKGLESVGVKCSEIIIKWTDMEEGQRCCECVCYYNKPYQVYNSDFFIKGLTTFSFVDPADGELEFSLMERL